MVEANGNMLTFSSQIKRGVDVSAYKYRFSDTGTFTYIGIAKPGTATSATTWMIKRVNNSTNDVDFAGGKADFLFEWDERTSYSYS